MPYPDRLRFLVNSIDNPVFALIHPTALEVSMVKILQLFEVLRGWIAAQRQNLDEDLFEDFGVRSAEVFKPGKSVL